MQYRKVPEVHVGIVRSGRLRFRFDGHYQLAGKGSGIEGPGEAEIKGKRLELKQKGLVLAAGKELVFHPVNPLRARFEISEVLIGIGFHWEQKEDQLFQGSLKLMIVEGEIQAINLVSVEDYLVSVISSEMRGDSSPALLKAHTIISRSWLLAQIGKKGRLAGSGESYDMIHETEEAYIRWYDRENHPDFHVCADDHCQRYQGITRAHNPAVLKAVQESSGQVLCYKGDICDARFSKCCGGVVEEFQYCWEPVKHPYLRRLIDIPRASAIKVDDLKTEANADSFIRSSPEAFCNTQDKDLLAQVLNDYDLASSNFFRWEVSYSQDELSDVIRKKSGRDFGVILDLLPLERGESGRLIRLKIVGSLKTMVVGKELEIRRWLSDSHLYSSAFIVEKQQAVNGIPGRFLLRGAGWGHGVGLCQIGAAVMARQGYSHEEILEHYFINAYIETWYEQS